MPEDDIVKVEGEEEDYLDGLCVFPDDAGNKPSLLRIATPHIGFTNLIKSVVIATQDGPSVVPYDPTKRYENVIGFIKNDMVIDFLQKAYDGKGIMLADPNNKKKLYTLKQWEEEFKTDGLAIILLMRLFWKDSKVEPKKIPPVVLGAGGRTTIR